MTFNRAPLPFQGQKRNFTKQFCELLKDEFSWHKDKIFIDAFGGSGLLSHNIKQIFPNARVIYNDFDGYSKRLANIETTNEIIKEIYPMFRGMKKNEKINQNVKEKTLKILKKYQDKGCFIDCLTISGLLLFSGVYAHDIVELERLPWYNKFTALEPKYNIKEYLNGVEIVSEDAIKLLDEYENMQPVLILDPPYLQTIYNGYKASWGIGEFLELSKRIKEPYIFFSSDASDILPFMDFMVREYDCKQFKNYKIKKASLAKWGKGTEASKSDYMIYKSSGGSLL